MVFNIFTPSSAVTHRLSLGRMVNQSTVLLMVSIGSLILLLALLILFHQNANATRGYQLRTLERERSYLLLDEELLQMKIAEAQALQQLESDRTVEVMVSVRNPIYTSEETTLAKINLEIENVE